MERGRREIKFVLKGGREERERPTLVGKRKK